MGGVQPSVLVSFQLSQLEKKKIDFEQREISNYPHLCPATMGGSR